MNELEMSDGRQFNRMKLTRFLGIQPREERVHQDMNLLGFWWNVISNINLSSAKHAALNRVHMTKYPLMDLQDVINTNVIIPKNKVEFKTT